MSAIPLTAAQSALLRVRARGLQEPDWSRRQVVRDLPPGSRIVDLDRHGMIIDVGSMSSGGKRGG